MKILVTGGAGFLGTHLCRRLLNDGHLVVCLDDMSTGSRENISELLGETRFQLVPENVQDVDFVYGDCFDRIYNLACPASPKAYQSYPTQTLLTNTRGVVNMINLAARTGARLLQASTSEVYGDPLQCPQKETYWGNVNPIGPRACYDEGKRCAEAFLVNADLCDRVRIARIFNTYGPGMRVDDGRVVSNFIAQALSGAPITIYGDGRQTRSFCYVDDMIDGLIALMESDERGPVNLGNPAEIEISDLADIIINMVGSKSQIVYRSLPQDDPVRRCPDISLAVSKLLWAPKIILALGLNRTITAQRKLSWKYDD